VTELHFFEWDGPRTVTLSDYESSFVQRYSRQLRCQPLGRGRYRLGPMPGFVGSLKLSTNTTITVQPRFGLNAFGELLGLAYQDQVIPSIPGSTSISEGSLSSWFIGQICHEAERLMSGRLRRDYVSCEDSLITPRGRIIFNSRSPSFAGLHVCDTERFDLDTDLNRAVKHVLRTVFSNVASDPWRPKISMLLHRLRSVGTVSDVKRTVLITALQSPVYRDYKRLFTLHRLLMESRGTEFSSGSIDVNAFFFKLHHLFELALYNALRLIVGSDIALHEPPNTWAAKHVTGAPHFRMTFKPDVALRFKPTTALREIRSSRWRLVVDAKYRDPIERTRFGPAFSSRNVQQLLAYAKAFECGAVLVYPRVNEDVDITYKVGEVFLRIVTVDLRNSAGEAIRAVASDIVANLA
jgi:5-methylcytosine-specific restriction endonuclease McrBC regulatory subunit McrC